MGIAAVANSRPKASATKKTGVKAAANKTKAKATKAKNKTAAKSKQNTSARKTSPAAIAKYQHAGAIAERARLRATGQLQVNKKKKATGKKKKKNSSRGFLSSLIPSRINPNFRGVGDTLVNGLYVVGGGGVTLIFSAILLAVADWVLPENWTNSRWAQPVATGIAALIVLPLTLSIKVFNFMGTTGKQIAGWSGVGVTIGQIVNEVANGDPFAKAANKIRQTAGELSSGNSTADEVASTAAGSGASDDEKAAAMSGALAGLRAHRMRREGQTLRFTPRGQSTNLWGNAARG